MGRKSYILLLLGISLRLILVGQPPVEDNSWIRQTQPADAIASWVEESPLALSAKASWRGDLNARLLLELPIYNLMVWAPAKLGVPLDVAGRLVSMLLWVAGFLLLQRLWMRWLDERETFWANFLFVFSPLSVAFGQAIMPEMLVQLLVIGMVLQAVRYGERPKAATWWAMVGLGLVGCLLKLPEVSHIYLLFTVALGWPQRWKSLFASRVLLGGLLTLAGLSLWGALTNKMNGEWFSEWNSSSNLKSFLGDMGGRLSLTNWTKFVAYQFLLLGSPVVWLAIVIGWRNIKASLGQNRWMLAWWVGLGGFVLLWGGPTCMAHAYYNLPFLIPVCWAFGQAMNCNFWRFKPVALGWMVAGVMAVTLPMTAYLLRPDPILAETTKWMKQYVPKSDLVIIKANHSVYTREYPQDPGFSYLSGRGVWIWTKFLLPAEQERAMQTARWIVVTHPPLKDPWWEVLRKKIKQHERASEDITLLLKETKAARVKDEPAFTAYKTHGKQGFLSVP
jgi:hypothetical protein